MNKQEAIGRIENSYTLQNYKTYKQSRYCQLTEAEIKQDFEWAWKFRKEVE